MAKLLFAAAATVVGGPPLAAQEVRPPPGAPAPAPAPSPAAIFRLERFAEDWSVMADPAQRTEPWHRLKWIDLGGPTLTIGGDLRLRGEYVAAPLFGATGARPDGYLLRRAMVHADLRAGRGLRGFVQLSHHRSFGRAAPFPLDRDGLELQQAFVEFSRAVGGTSAGVRAGRQEIIFSPRFVNPREAVNIRSAYDGVRGWVQHGPWRLDGFATRPVQNRPGAFDNRGNPGETFSGARLTRTIDPAARWRVTASWYRQTRERYAIGTVAGADARDSWGLRLTGREGRFDLDAEHYLQAGTLAGRAIRAWGGGGEAGYALAGRARPRVAVRWLYGSGDGRPADGVVRTFAGPFPRPPCCIDPLWLAPSNLAAVSPLVQLIAGPEVSIEAKADLLWRLERNDAVYAFPQIAYPRTAGQPGDLIGVAPALSVTWTPTPELAISLHHVEQSTRGALAAAGARHSSFSVASAAFRF